MIRDVRERPRRRQALGPQLFTGGSGAQPVEAKFQPPRNQPFFVKPTGGLWTSTYSEEDGSDWVRWCLAEGYAGPVFRCWLLQPNPSARVFEIDSYADLGRGLDRYGLSQELGLSMKILDFEAMARDYDAIHLTHAGRRATHLSAPHNLYGWDCETTLWLHWSFAGEPLDLGHRQWPAEGA
jgi:hypothetical protein